MKLTGENRSIRGKTCLSATLSTINPIWTDPGSNPGLRGERPFLVFPSNKYLAIYAPDTRRHGCDSSSKVTDTVVILECVHKLQ
jgi:hypothetical protein